MKLLHEEYHCLGQLLDEVSSVEAIQLAESYFADQDEDSFGLSEVTIENDHNIMSRFAAKKEA